jgi:hypothetical protein
MLSTSLDLSMHVVDVQMMLDSLAIDILSVGDQFERPEDRALGYAAVDWEGGSLQ